MPIFSSLELPNNLNVRPVFMSMCFGHVIPLGDTGEIGCLRKIQCFFMTLDVHPELVPLHPVESDMVRGWASQVMDLLMPHERTRIVAVLSSRTDIEVRETKVA